jgi:hypothetical protein
MSSWYKSDELAHGIGTLYAGVALANMYVGPLSIHMVLLIRYAGLEDSSPLVFWQNSAWLMALLDGGGCSSSKAQQQLALP